MLVAPVEDTTENLRYPLGMSNDEYLAEIIEDGEDQHDGGSDDETIVSRGEHYSPAEMQKGLTVFTAAIFIIGEMTGSGLLALPAAMVGAGWTGFGLLVLCCFASGYCGTVLGRSWAILRDRYEEYRGHVRYPYPAIGERAYGRWASITVTVCIQITLVGKNF